MIVSYQTSGLSNCFNFKSLSLSLLDLLDSFIFPSLISPTPVSDALGDLLFAIWLSCCYHIFPPLSVFFLAKKKDSEHGFLLKY